MEEKKASSLKVQKSFQLYNAAHKSALEKLLQGAKLYKLADQDKDDEIEDTEENSKSDTEFPTLPDDVEPLSLNINLNEGCGLACTTCEISFPDAQVQRAHYRLDWHRYNVKRRIHGQKPVDDVQFDEMMDGLSSISGSEDESESAPSKAQVTRLLDKVEEYSESENDVAKETKAERKLIGSPKAFFENQEGNMLCVYKALLPHSEPNQVKDDLNLSEFLKTPRKCGIILSSSGHFAGAVFEDGKDIMHKTFHTYTVRAKQGGAESSAGPHKSAGSSLRRHNEASLFQNIQDTLESWKSLLEGCMIIYYRMGSSNQNVLFSGKNPPLKRNDSRLRTIPFPTKRPTFSEVKNVLAKLTSVKVLSKTEFMDQFVITKKEIPRVNAKEAETSPNRTKSKQKKNKNIDRCRSRSSPAREIPGKFPSSSEDGSNGEEGMELIAVDQEVDFSELREYDDSLSPEERQRKFPKRKKPKKPKPVFNRPEGLLGELLDLLEKSDPLFVDRLKTEFQNKPDLDQTKNLLEELNQPIDLENSTLLHLASKAGLQDAIWCLMEFGFDPSLKDKSGKYPYNYSEAKECRNLYRKFRAQYPDKFDYQKSQIPEPLTEEMEQEKAEKKRIINKLKRDKERQKKAERKEKQDEIDEKTRFLNLSDREKRALAAEKRIIGERNRGGEKMPVLVRCFECAIDITGKVPFEYNKNVFCTTTCLATHRKKFPVPLSV